MHFWEVQLLRISFLSFLSFFSFCLFTFFYLSMFSFTASVTPLFLSFAHFYELLGSFWFKGVLYIFQTKILHVSVFLQISFPNLWDFKKLNDFNIIWLVLGFTVVQTLTQRQINAPITNIWLKDCPPQNTPRLSHPWGLAAVNLFSLWLHLSEYNRCLTFGNCLLQHSTVSWRLTHKAEVTSVVQWCHGPQLCHDLFIRSPDAEDIWVVTSFYDYRVACSI
jgi:hypothetical protein